MKTEAFRGLDPEMLQLSTTGTSPAGPGMDPSLENEAFWGLDPEMLQFLKPGAIPGPGMDPGVEN